MTWAVFLNNQLAKQVTLLPNGQSGTATRYIFIEGRNVPIILKDEESTLPLPYAVSVDDGSSPHYQLGYKGEGQIWITLMEVDGNLQYTTDSGYTKYTHIIPF